MRKISNLPREQILKVLIFVVVLIGAGLRLNKFLISGSVSFDEAYSFWVGSKSLFKVIALAAVDKHPPLYYLFMHFWEMVSNSEVWIRLPSFLASVASLFIFIKVAKKFVKEDYLVLFALLLFAVDLSQIQFASIARSYAINSLLVLISSWAFFEILESPGPRQWYVVNLASNILLTLIVYTGAFVFLAQLVIIVLFRQIGQLDNAVFKRWIKYHVFLLVVLLALIPYVYNQLQVGGFAPKWIANVVGEPYLETLFMQGTLLNTRLYKVQDFVFKVSVGSFIALVIFLGAVLKRDSLQFKINNNQKFWYLIVVYATPPLVFWGVSKIEPIFVPRYFMMFYFAYYLLLVYALDHLKYIRKFSAVFVLAFVAGVVPLFEAFYTDFYKESDWNSKSAVIRENWKDGDLLFVIPHADGVRAKYYLKDMQKYKIDKEFYRSIFKSKTKVITTADLDTAFKINEIPYKRLWFHEEENTGLASEFEVVQHQGFIHSYLDSLYYSPDSLSFKDDRGELRLYILKP